MQIWEVGDGRLWGDGENGPLASKHKSAANIQARTARHDRQKRERRIAGYDFPAGFFFFFAVCRLA